MCTDTERSFFSRRTFLWWIMGLFYGRRHLCRSCVGCPRPSCQYGCQWFCNFCMLMFEKETNKILLTLCLQLEYGIIICSVSLHLSLSSSTNPYLCSKSLSVYTSCQYGCQWFCNCCTLIFEIRDKQNTSNNLLIVGVWNYNVLCITAPISVFLYQ